MSERPNITACAWRLFPPNLLEQIEIVERAQIDGSLMYAVIQRGFVLTRAGEWEYEPIPSSRDEAFIARCRFLEWEDAARAALRAAGSTAVAIDPDRVELVHELMTAAKIALFGEAEPGARDQVLYDQLAAALARAATP